MYNLVLYIFGAGGPIILLYRSYKHYNHKHCDYERFIIIHPFIEEYTVIDNQARTVFNTNKRENIEYFELLISDTPYNDWCVKEKTLAKIYLTSAIPLILIILVSIIF